MVKFPSRLEEFLPPQAVSKVLDLLSQPALTSAVRETLQKVGIKDANPVGQVQDAWRQARGWFESMVERVLEQNQASPAAINATGQLFDARWSSLPGDSAAVQALVASAINFQDQGQLELYAAHTVKTRLGAEAAIFVSSTAAALALLTRAEAFQGGLVIARSDVLRVAGPTDVRAILDGGKHPFQDVGAVNGTTPEEWQTALTAKAQTLVRLSPNSLEAQEARGQSQAAGLQAVQVGAKVVDVVLDGTLDEGLAALGFPRLNAMLSTGSDLVIAPLDGLLGGVTGAVVAGRQNLVQSLRSAAQSLGVLLHGPALAAAAAIFARPAEAPRSSVGQLLLTNSENLKERARRLAVQLNDTTRVATAEVLARQTRLGPSPYHRHVLATHAVVLSPRAQTAEEFSKALASGQLGSVIWTKVEGDRVVLDLRLVEPADDHKIVEACSAT